MEGFPQKDRVLSKRVRARRGVRDETAIILCTPSQTHTNTHRAFKYRYLHKEVCTRINTEAKNQITNMSQTCIYHGDCPNE